MDAIYEIINSENKTVGIATSEQKAHQLRHAIKTGQPIHTPIAAQEFLASVFQQAVLTGDNATTTDCLYQLRELYKENQTNSDNKSRSEQ